MPLLILAILIGIIAGLRSMTAPAVVSWAARLGWIHVHDSWLTFLGYAWTPWILSICAVGELIVDKLPFTPSRKLPPSFAFRIVSGSISGAAIGIAHGSLVTGLVGGAIGAVIGTLGGAAARSALAKRFGKDLPAALLEDAVAVVGAILILKAAA
ncbi:DUF4126 domain-containing protein [Occallatibacter savannae]|uniref:DUF4126 domain-containing protein n=1 Tax=Occallatibacter savannae TaxID=1002691 RepID=UPI000D69CF3D|nr:DUF4126 domain-containing protein [Occallatibacter savannae]